MAPNFLHCTFVLFERLFKLTSENGLFVRKSTVRPNVVTKNQERDTDTNEAGRSIPSERETDRKRERERKKERKKGRKEKRGKEKKQRKDIHCDRQRNVQNCLLYIRWVDCFERLMVQCFQKRIYNWNALTRENPKKSRAKSFVFNWNGENVFRSEWTENWSKKKLCRPIPSSITRRFVVALEDKDKESAKSLAGTVHLTLALESGPEVARTECVTV